MGEAAKPSLAQRIDEIIREAFIDVVQDAREEGWREGYAAGRLEVRREMNTRLRALILEEEGSSSIPAATVAASRSAPSLHALFDQMFQPLRREAMPDPAEHAGEDAPDAKDTAEAAADEPVDPDGEQETAQQDGASEPHEHPPEPAEEAASGTTTAAAVPAAGPVGPGAETGLNQPPPPPQQPAAPAAALPASTGSAPASKPVWPPDWRTDDRKKAFILLYESGTDMTEIRLALADIAGPRVPDKNAPLWAWVTALRIRRNADATVAEPTQPENQGVGADRRGPPQDTTAPQQPSRPPAIHPSIAHPGPRPDGINPKAKVIDLPPPAPNGKIYTSFYNIRAWAGVYGITYDGTNIDKVNKLRTAKSMPPLVQEG